MELSKFNKEINILMLGETGVGKSTFINAFANYLTYSTLDEAVYQAENVVLIPTTFTVTDDDFREQQVKLIKTPDVVASNPLDDWASVDANEVQEVGKSATQSCLCYEFPFNDFAIRIIDTPGIGDSRGVNADKSNMANVMSFISNYEAIHAICILMKPNNNRLTASFKFCVSQLLCHLSKLAIQNIVFVFTNAKATNYRPGGSLSLLRIMFGEMDLDVRIELTKDRLYCFDNEAFNFIGAVKNGHRLSEYEKESCEKSWQMASKECGRLIRRIIGDEATPGLMPHNVMDTVLLNDARNLIVALIEPLAEITQNIQDNLTILTRKKRELNENKNDISKLKDKLFTPILEIEYVELPAPAAVCDHEDCCEYYYVSGLAKKHRKQKCHLVCEPGPIVSGFASALFGSHAMYWCNAMDIYGYCKVCQHHYSSHLKVNTETKVIEKQVEDEFFCGLIDSMEIDAKKLEEFVKSIEKRWQLYTKEQHTIVSASAKFASFLKQNAIAGFNDAFGIQLQTEIENAKIIKSKGVDNFAEIRRLQGMMQQYEAEMEIYKQAQSLSLEHKLIDSNEIMKTVEELFQLELTGKKIKEAYDKRGWTTINHSCKKSTVTYRRTRKSAGLGEQIETIVTQLAKTVISAGLNMFVSKTGLKY